MWGVVGRDWGVGVVVRDLGVWRVDGTRSGVWGWWYEIWGVEGGGTRSGGVEGGGTRSGVCGWWDEISSHHPHTPVLVPQPPHPPESRPITAQNTPIIVELLDKSKDNLVMANIAVLWPYV